MDNEGLSLSKLFKNIYINHKDVESTYSLNKESGEVFAQYFDSVESKIAVMEADGYKGYVERKIVGGTLNKSAVSVITHGSMCSMSSLHCS